MASLLALLHGLGRPRLLVVGDLILDRYTWGDVDRVSPEAPVLVLRADRDEARPGGAASVAALARALEADVTLAGVVGADAAGRALLTLLRDQGIDTGAVLADPARPTTTKERIIGRAAGRHAQQVLRVDREVADPLAPALEARLADGVQAAIARHAAVLVADYAKGVCTPGLLRCILDRARACGLPVLIDPARGANYALYRGATILAPNRVETALAAGRPIDTPAAALAAAADLRGRCGVAAVLVKLDKDGMVLVEGDDGGRHFPTLPREVYDVTGAGDMVLALLGLGRAAGLAWADAVPLANVAAGLEVERLGVAPVSRAELAAACAAAEPAKQVSLADMEALAAAYRRAGKTVVFTNGCFDLLHVGHANYLAEAAALGDVLVVAVNSDAGVRRLKGPDRPVIKEADRAAMLAALACVDHVLIFEDDTPLELLHRLRPDVLVKGGTYREDEVVGKEVVEAYGGRVCVVGHVGGVSTTEILATVRKNAGEASGA